jgi:hypothetical protein
VEEIESIDYTSFLQQIILDLDFLKNAFVLLLSFMIIFIIIVILYQILKDFLF